MFKISILDKLIKNGLRCFKSELYKGQVSHFMQYHAGGEDYNPSAKIRAIGEFVNNNPANGVIIGYQDDVPRISLEGEKRIYAVNGNDEVVAEIYLKNTGDLNITAFGNCNINANTGCVINSPDVFINGNIGTSTGETAVIPCGTSTLTFTDGLLTKVST